MDPYEEKLKHFLKENNIDAEHLSFEVSCHSVREAALAVKDKEDAFVKNICLITEEGELIVAIVKGEDRVSKDNVEENIKQKMRIATPDEILKKTGYPCGGTPSFGYKAIFLIDERVMGKKVVYSGGGSEKALVKISPKELMRVNKGEIVKIRKI